MQRDITPGGQRRPGPLSQGARQRLHGKIVTQQEAIEGDGPANGTGNNFRGKRPRQLRVERLVTHMRAEADRHIV